MLLSKASKISLIEPERIPFVPGRPRQIRYPYEDTNQSYTEPTPMIGHATTQRRLRGYLCQDKFSITDGPLAQKEYLLKTLPLCNFFRADNDCLNLHREDVTRVLGSFSSHVVEDAAGKLTVLRKALYLPVDSHDFAQQSFDVFGTWGAELNLPQRRSGRNYYTPLALLHEQLREPGVFCSQPTKAHELLVWRHLIVTSDVRMLPAQGYGHLLPPSAHGNCWGWPDRIIRLTAFVESQWRLPPDINTEDALEILVDQLWKNQLQQERAINKIPDGGKENEGLTVPEAAKLGTDDRSNEYGRSSYSDSRSSETHVKRPETAGNQEGITCFETASGLPVGQEIISSAEFIPATEHHSIPSKVAIRGGEKDSAKPESREPYFLKTWKEFLVVKAGFDHNEADKLTPEAVHAVMAEMAAKGWSSDQMFDVGDESSSEDIEKRESQTLQPSESFAEEAASDGGIWASDLDLFKQFLHWTDDTLDLVEVSTLDAKKILSMAASPNIYISWMVKFNQWIIEINNIANGERSGVMRRDLSKLTFVQIMKRIKTLASAEGLKKAERHLPTFSKTTTDGSVNRDHFLELLEMMRRIMMDKWGWGRAKAGKVLFDYMVHSSRNTCSRPDITIAQNELDAIPSDTYRQAHTWVIWAEQFLAMKWGYSQKRLRAIMDDEAPALTSKEIAQLQAWNLEFDDWVWKFAAIPVSKDGIDLRDSIMKKKAVCGKGLLLHVLSLADVAAKPSGDPDVVQHANKAVAGSAPKHSSALQTEPRIWMEVIHDLELYLTAPLRTVLTDFVVEKLGCKKEAVGSMSWKTAAHLIITNNWMDEFCPWAMENYMTETNMQKFIMNMPGQSESPDDTKLKIAKWTLAMKDLEPHLRAPLRTVIEEFITNKLGPEKRVVDRMSQQMAADFIIVNDWMDEFCEWAMANHMTATEMWAYIMKLPEPNMSPADKQYKLKLWTVAMEELEPYLKIPLQNAQHDFVCLVTASDRDKVHDSFSENPAHFIILNDLMAEFFPWSMDCYMSENDRKCYLKNIASWSNQYLEQARSPSKNAEDSDQDDPLRPISPTQSLAMKHLELSEVFEKIDWFISGIDERHTQAIRNSLGVNMPNRLNLKNTIRELDLVDEDLIEYMTDGHYLKITDKIQAQLKKELASNLNARKAAAILAYSAPAGTKTQTVGIPLTKDHIKSLTVAKPEQEPKTIARQQQSQGPFRPRNSQSKDSHDLIAATEAVAPQTLSPLQLPSNNLFATKYLESQTTRNRVLLIPRARDNFAQFVQRNLVEHFGFDRKAASKMSAEHQEKLEKILADHAAKNGTLGTKNTTPEIKKDSLEAVVSAEGCATAKGNAADADTILQSGTGAIATVDKSAKDLTSTTTIKKDSLESLVAAEGSPTAEGNKANVDAVLQNGTVPSVTLNESSTDLNSTTQINKDSLESLVAATGSPTAEGNTANADAILQNVAGAIATLDKSCPDLQRTTQINKDSLEPLVAAEGSPTAEGITVNADSVLQNATGAIAILDDSAKDLKSTMLRGGSAELFKALGAITPTQLARIDHCHRYFLKIMHKLDETNSDATRALAILEMFKEAVITHTEVDDVLVMQMEQQHVNALKELIQKKMDSEAGSHLKTETSFHLLADGADDIQIEFYINRQTEDDLRKFVEPFGEPGDQNVMLDQFRSKLVSSRAMSIELASKFTMHHVNRMRLRIEAYDKHPELVAAKTLQRLPFSSNSGSSNLAPSSKRFEQKSETLDDVVEECRRHAKGKVDKNHKLYGSHPKDFKPTTKESEQAQAYVTNSRKLYAFGNANLLDGNLYGADLTTNSAFAAAFPNVFMLLSNPKTSIAARKSKLNVTIMNPTTIDLNDLMGSRGPSDNHLTQIELAAIMKMKNESQESKSASGRDVLKKALYLDFKERIEHQAQQKRSGGICSVPLEPKGSWHEKRELTKDGRFLLNYLTLMWWREEQEGQATKLQEVAKDVFLLHVDSDKLPVADADCEPKDSPEEAAKKQKEREKAKAKQKRQKANKKKRAEAGLVADSKEPDEDNAGPPAEASVPLSLLLESFTPGPIAPAEAVPSSANSSSVPVVSEDAVSHAPYPDLATEEADFSATPEQLPVVELRDKTIPKPARGPVVTVVEVLNEEDESADHNDAGSSQMKARSRKTARKAKKPGKKSNKKAKKTNEEAKKDEVSDVASVKDALASVVLDAGNLSEKSDVDSLDERLGIPSIVVNDAELSQSADGNAAEVAAADRRPSTDSSCTVVSDDHVFEKERLHSAVSMPSTVDSGQPSGSHDLEPAKVDTPWLVPGVASRWRPAFGDPVEEVEHLNEHYFEPVVSGIDISSLRPQTMSKEVMFGDLSRHAVIAGRPASWFADDIKSWQPDVNATGHGASVCLVQSSEGINEPDEVPSSSVPSPNDGPSGELVNEEVDALPTTECAAAVSEDGRISPKTVDPSLELSQDEGQGNSDAQQPMDGFEAVEPASSESAPSGPAPDKSTTTQTKDASLRPRFYDKAIYLLNHLIARLDVINYGEAAGAQIRSGVPLSVDQQLQLRLRPLFDGCHESQSYPVSETAKDGQVISKEISSPSELREHSGEENTASSHVSIDGPLEGEQLDPAEDSHEGPPRLSAEAASILNDYLDEAAEVFFNGEHSTEAWDEATLADDPPQSSSSSAVGEGEQPFEAPSSKDVCPDATLDNGLSALLLADPGSDEWLFQYHEVSGGVQTEASPAAPEVSTRQAPTSATISQGVVSDEVLPFLLNDERSRGRPLLQCKDGVWSKRPRIARSAHQTRPSFDKFLDDETPIADKKNKRTVFDIEPSPKTIPPKEDIVTESGGYSTFSKTIPPKEDTVPESSGYSVFSKTSVEILPLTVNHVMIEPYVPDLRPRLKVSVPWVGWPAYPEIPHVYDCSKQMEYDELPPLPPPEEELDFFKDTRSTPAVVADRYQKLRRDELIMDFIDQQNLTIMLIERELEARAIEEQDAILLAMAEEEAVTAEGSTTAEEPATAEEPVVAEEPVAAEESVMAEVLVAAEESAMAKEPLALAKPAKKSPNPKSRSQSSKHLSEAIASAEAQGKKFKKRGEIAALARKERALRTGSSSKKAQAPPRFDDKEFPSLGGSTAPRTQPADSYWGRRISQPSAPSNTEVSDISSEANVSEPEVADDGVADEPPSRKVKKKAARKDSETRLLLSSVSEKLLKLEASTPADEPVEESTCIEQTDAKVAPVTEPEGKLTEADIAESLKPVEESTCVEQTDADVAPATEPEGKLTEAKIAESLKPAKMSWADMMDEDEEELQTFVLPPKIENEVKQRRPESCGAVWSRGASNQNPARENLKPETWPSLSGGLQKTSQENSGTLQHEKQKEATVGRPTFSGVLSFGSASKPAEKETTQKRPAFRPLVVSKKLAQPTSKPDPVVENKEPKQWSTLFGSKPQPPQVLPGNMVAEAPAMAENPSRGADYQHNAYAAKTQNQWRSNNSSHTATPVQTETLDPVLKITRNRAAQRDRKREQEYEKRMEERAERYPWTKKEFGKGWEEKKDENKGENKGGNMGSLRGGKGIDSPSWR